MSRCIEDCTLVGGVLCTTRVVRHGRARSAKPPLHDLGHHPSDLGLESALGQLILGLAPVIPRVTGRKPAVNPSRLAPSVR